MKIITSLFTDKHDYSKNPQLYHLNNSHKRLVYWKCCATFFATSVKVNPDEQHVLYTNDADDIFFNGVNIKEFLTDLGVEIIYLPLKLYNVPHKYSSFLAGAFYKLEVLNELQIGNNSDICLLDSDCIWLKSCERIKEIIGQGKIVLFDVYKLKGEDSDPHGNTKQEMYEVFRQLNPEYPNPAPVRYGGEIIAGDSDNIRVIAKSLSSAYRKIITELDELPRFKNGKKFMDGMEIFSSYVYNIIPMEKVDSEEEGILRRIWTAPKVNNVKKSDKNLMIWHLIAEKHRGIPLLAEKVIDRNSVFWKVENKKACEYLGGYLGIPERKVKVKEASIMERLIPKITNRIREKFFWN
jgi:hypothetical protein